MDVLWFLNATFWEKMFFTTNIAGVATFIYYLIEIAKEIKGEII